MIRRALLALPLPLALGCAGAAPPPAAPGVQSADAPSATPGAEPSTAPSALPQAAGATTPAPSNGAGKSVQSAVVATDAPIATAITQKDVLDQANKHMDVFGACYDLGAKGSKTWRAKVTVKATVGPSGAVNAVDVVNSTANNPKVDACVADGFKKLAFARPKGAGTTTFTFPMVFDGFEEQR